MPKVLSSLIVFAALAAPCALHADTYTYTITTADTPDTPGSTFTSSGTLSGPADPFVAGAYDINAITGAASSYTFSGIVNAGTNSQVSATQDGFTFDNVLYTGGGNLVDSSGFLLNLTSPAGLSLAHVYYNNGYEVDVLDPNDPGDVTPFSVSNFEISPTPVPEPGTLALLSTGLLGAAAMLRRRSGLE